MVDLSESDKIKNLNAPLHSKKIAVGKLTITNKYWECGAAPGKESAWKWLGRKESAESVGKNLMQIHIIKDIAQRSAVVQQEETRLINGIKKIKKIKRKRRWKKKDADIVMSYLFQLVNNRFFVVINAGEKNIKKGFRQERNCKG